MEINEYLIVKNHIYTSRNSQIFFFVLLVIGLFMMIKMKYGIIKSKVYAI